ncbi:hypothetical protein MMC07_009927 [Pseudocyphellaria aurata]|nr:hypothetical protein [Pseudocyphellaria aurata]
MSILAVPTEVQQLIIEELLRSEDLKVLARYKYCYGFEEQDEPIFIYHDLINWSCIHSHFRNLLAPYIFKTVKLVNDEESGASLDAVARSPHCVHVENLHFIGDAPDEANDEESDGEESKCENPNGARPNGEESASSVHDEFFPRSVDGLLSNLQRFPRLERLSIRFNHFYDDGRDGGDFPPAETPDEVLEAEAQSPWRALMCRVYAALSRNKTPHVKHLDIRQLLRKEVSTFGHAPFHDFLGHLEEFTLSIHGELEGWGCTDPGYYYNCTKEYPALMGILDKFFFDHLAHVTTLSIKAPEEGPLGLEGRHYCHLALKAGQMPLLTTLLLEYVFASPELIDFLVGHKDTLEEVTLRNCYASIEEADNGIYGICWSKLFKSLWSAHPAKLRRFELVRDKPDPPFKTEELNHEQQDTVETLLQDPGNIIFPYASLGLYTGRLVLNGEETWASFEVQKDQKYWDRLMKLVDGSAMKVIEE